MASTSILAVLVVGLGFILVSLVVLFHELDHRKKENEKLRELYSRRVTELTRRAMRG